MRSLTRKVAVLAVLATMAIAGQSWASAESDLAAAENSYAALDFASAAQMADRVLAQKGLSHDVLQRATRVAALSHAAVGDSEVATKQFVRMLQFDPTFKVDSKLGPRFSGPFAEAKGYWQAQGQKPGMEIESVAQWKQGGQIRVSTTDPLNVLRHVTIGFRWAPTHEYTVATTDAAGVKQADVPANPEGSSRLEYYVRALDANDDAIFEEGTPDLPKTVTVTEPRRAEEKKSILASPFFYIIGGAIIAGASVGGYYLFRGTEYTAATQGRAVIGAKCGGMACD